MRILVIGSGGREHALCWKITKSPRCEKLYCAPGNGGISETAELVNIAAEDMGGLLKFAREKKIDLTIVGSEAPLVKGIVDNFKAAGLKIFGPTKELAAIEGSKVFAKELMKKLGVPTADFKVFDNSDKALGYVKTRPMPVVVKADGLAAGKGVVICKTLDEAKDAISSMMIGRVFGEAGRRIIIEECLYGEEASIIVIADGANVIGLASSQDHKRVYDGDKGPNTGGMGAYSPAPIVTDAILKKVLETIISPIIKDLNRQGKPYKGALYAGIMITKDGPKVLEFNARFGDPETQAILPRLKSDLVDIIEKAVNGGLKGYDIKWDKRPCVSVVIASGGYPGEYDKGIEIEGLDQAKSIKDVVVFHAGTKTGNRSTDAKNLFVTSGGRVLNVTALGDDVKGAAANCYKAIEKIKFSRMHYRKDIGYRAIKETGSSELGARS